MLSISLTNPANDMLLGFETQLVTIRDKETEEVFEGMTFSIGLFFVRFDFLFNMKPVEDEVI